MAKQKFYAVRKGMTPGVYLSWEECRAQVDGYSGAVYKSFPTREEAEDFVGVISDLDEMVREQTDAAHKGEKGGEGSRGSSTIEEHYSLPEEMVVPEGMAVAYVDGSYNVATGDYSCGIVFMAEGEEVHLAKMGENRDLASMRNVAGEILGAELAMKRAVERGMRKLSIYYDYQGISAWCLGDWKTNKEGTRAYKEYYDSVKDRIEIEFVKVRGHSGDTYNDLADKLAKSVLCSHVDV